MRKLQTYWHQDEHRWVLLDKIVVVAKLAMSGEALEIDALYKEPNVCLPRYLQAEAASTLRRDGLMYL